jgi:hypothetical protein
VSPDARKYADALVSVRPTDDVAVVRRALTIPHAGVTVPVSDDEVDWVPHQVVDGPVDLTFDSYFDTRSGMRCERILCLRVAPVRPRYSIASVPVRPRAAPSIAPRDRRVVNLIHAALALVAAGERGVRGAGPCGAVGGFARARSGWSGCIYLASCRGHSLALEKRVIATSCR